MDFNPYDVLDAEGATDADPQALQNLSKPAAKKEEPKGKMFIIRNRCISSDVVRNVIGTGLPKGRHYRGLIC